MISKVAPGVFVVDHECVEGKNGIVIGERAALAIDTGIAPQEGQAMADFIRSRKHDPDRLAFTHGHGDHVLGSAAFLGAEVIASRQSPALMRQSLPQWAERAGVSPDDLEARIAWPNMTFVGGLYIDLGDKHVRLFGTPGHSPDSISAYVEEDRVLFAGDTVFSGILPSISNGDSRELQAALRMLSNMRVEVLVPGHGAVLQGVENVQEWLQWLIAYLERVQAFVRAGLEKGQESEAIVALAEYGHLVGDRVPMDAHNMFERHRNVVVKIVQEEAEDGE
jgi:glyoxylase-like metal-dependent hydrolase (beta-lactamase superfamily II)